MPPKRASSTKSTAAKSTPSKPARPATTAKAAVSAGKGKAAAAKARSKPKPKPVTKLAPEYPSSTPRRSSRQGPILALVYLTSWLKCLHLSMAHISTLEPKTLASRKLLSLIAYKTAKCMISLSPPVLQSR